MDERILKQLYETFPLSERKGTGGMIFKYVPNEDVINRMNKVFEGNWCTRVKDKDIVDDQVIVEVQVEVYADDHCYTQTGFGSQQIMRYTQGPNAGKIIDIGNAYKGALAKGIVNACTRWGVGLFKESNPYEMDNITMVAENTAPAAAPVAPAAPAAPAPAAPAAPVVPAAPVAQTPPATPAPAAPAAPATPAPVAPAPVAPAPVVPAAAPTPPVAPPAPAAPAAPVVENTTVNPTPPAAPNQPVATSVELVQEEVAPPAAPSMPSFPAPDAAPATPELPMSSPTGDLDRVGISDVQRVALNGILTMHSADYDELAREAFDNKGMAQAVPPKENLSYEEAVVVIKYGNDKFKKNR